MCIDKNLVVAVTAKRMCLGISKFVLYLYSFPVIPAK